MWLGGHYVFDDIAGADGTIALDYQFSRVRLLLGADSSLEFGARNSPVFTFGLLANVRITQAGKTDRHGLLPSFHTSDQGAGCITGMIEVEEIGDGLRRVPASGAAPKRLVGRGTARGTNRLQPGRRHPPWPAR